MPGLASALHAFQGDAPALQRDAINPHFGSQYLSLEALLGDILPVLNAHGLVLSQWPTTLDGLPALRTRLTHAESGESEEDTMLLEQVKRDPQGQGSAITYARRYSLMAALGLSADKDDDANAATGSRGKSSGQRPRARGPALITAAQRDDLVARVRAKGVPPNQATRLIREAAGVDNSAAIPASKLAAVLKAIDGYQAAA